MRRSSRPPGGMADMRGKVCLVTGGARGLGLAVTRALTRQGAHVHVVDAPPGNPESTVVNPEVAALGPQVTCHHLDVSDRSAYEQCIAQVHAAGGRLDVLINNSTLVQWSDVQQMSVEDTLLTMRTGYDAVVCGVKAALPLMRAADGGHIVNIGYATGVLFGRGHSAAYTAAKEAINAYTQILSGELAASPVHVMLVRPAPVRSTEFIGRHIPSRRVQRIADFLLVCTPEQVADAIVNGILTRREIVDVPGYLAALYRAHALSPSAYRPRPRAQTRTEGLTSVVINKIGPARWLGAVTRAIVVPLDTRLQTGSAGRLSVGQSLGMTTLLLTTTGARTGQPRLTPLFYVDHADGYAVVGSNFGLTHHPAWTVNLLNNPIATVTTKGLHIPVTARLVNGSEREEIWTKLVNFFAGYQTYSDRSGRNLRVFHLQPRHSTQH